MMENKVFNSLLIKGYYTIIKIKQEKKRKK